MPAGYSWPKYRPTSHRGVTHLLQSPRRTRFACGQPYDRDRYTRTNALLGLCGMCKHAYKAL